MLYRTVPKNGDRLSILGFGCMRLAGRNERIDEKSAAAQIHQAVDQGVNYLDTAFPYHLGASEPFLGRILKEGYRDKVRLATKLPPWSVKSREGMDRILDSQLKRLNSDHIDYYLIHALEGENWPKIRGQGVLDFLDEAKREGKILNAGFSFHGDLDTFKEIVDAYDWEVCQIQYNYLDEKNQAGTEGLEYAASKDLGVIVMEPLRGGNLAGRIPWEVQAVWDRAEVKRTPAEWALRWVWNRPEVTCVLSGMNRDEHVDENLRIAVEALPDSLTGDELDLIKEVEGTYRRLMKVDCTGCRYCLPCPEEVDIPTCFYLYNNKYLFGDKRAGITYILHLAGTLHGTHYASLCKDCGKCVKKCPQRLPIPHLLREVAGEFEGPMMKPVSRLAGRFVSYMTWRDQRRAHRKREA
ncbi:MAG: aldo/keto reductase [Actinomycetota bacterium]|nr:aldo/keto reductase [Actinomycetota bacterium]